MDAEQIRTNLRRRRIAAGLTQYDIAHRCGMTTVQYSNRELGKTKMSVSELIRFADILGCKFSSLLDQLIELTHVRWD